MITLTLEFFDSQCGTPTNWQSKCSSQIFNQLLKYKSSHLVESKEVIMLNENI